jgi:uncharacterized protein (DUF1800 family)
LVFQIKESQAIANKGISAFDWFVQVDFDASIPDFLEKVQRPSRTKTQRQLLKDGSERIKKCEKRKQQITKQWWIDKMMTAIEFPYKKKMTLLLHNHCSHISKR